MSTEPQQQQQQQEPEHQPDASTHANIPSESVGSIVPDKTNRRSRKIMSPPVSASDVRKMEKKIESLQKRVDKMTAQNTKMKDEIKLLRASNSRILRIPKATA